MISNSDETNSSKKTSSTRTRGIRRGGGIGQIAGGDGNVMGPYNGHFLCGFASAFASHSSVQSELVRSELFSVFNLSFPSSLSESDFLVSFVDPFIPSVVPFFVEVFVRCHRHSQSKSRNSSIDQSVSQYELGS